MAVAPTKTLVVQAGADVNKILAALRTFGVIATK